VLKEFKDFIMKGNLVEIAVGLVLALAFTVVVQSLVSDVITPIIGAIGGQADFGDLTIKIGDAHIFYGRFINALISFVIIGFVLFLIVKAYNRMVLTAKRGGQEEEVTEPGEDVLLLREIRDTLRTRG
jgi:large conductance mechanosensitive channel